MLINYKDGDFKQNLKDAGLRSGRRMTLLAGNFQRRQCVSGMGGRHVVIGFAAGGSNPKDAIPKIPLNLALLNEREILGCFWGAWKMQDGNVANRKNIEKMLSMVAQGQMRPVVSRTYDLADYPQAFDAMMSRRVVGKVTINVSGEGGATSRL